MVGFPGPPREKGHCLWLSLGRGRIISRRPDGLTWPQAGEQGRSQGSSQSPRALGSDGAFTGQPCGLQPSAHPCSHGRAGCCPATDASLSRSPACSGRPQDIHGNWRQRAEAFNSCWGSRSCAIPVLPGRQDQRLLCTAARRTEGHPRGHSEEPVLGTRTPGDAAVSVAVHRAHSPMTSHQQEEGVTLGTGPAWNMRCRPLHPTQPPL